MIKKLALTLISGFIVTSVNAQFWKYSEPIKLPGTVNTGAEESIPIFSKDSSMLYFVRTMDPSNQGGEQDQDIWFSTKDENGNYTDCQRLKDVNNKFNNAVVGLSTNGERMYLFNAYDGKKDQDKGIAVATGRGSSWATPEKLEINGLSITGDFYGFHVNGKEDVIIISYNGPGSLGEEDLYVSLKAGNSWSVPMHMGNAINSTGFEISPFLNASQDTLFFSSNGMGGEGDADIFFSVKQGLWNQWSKPVNLGSLINSPKFDAYFSYSGSQAYWSSNRDSERSEIYMVHIFNPPPLEITCTTKDASEYKGNDGSIDLVVNSGAEPYSYAWSNGATTEDLQAVGKGDYEITVTDAIGQISMLTCSVDEPPMPIEPVTVTEYENIAMKHQFGYNKAKMAMNHGELKQFVKDIEAQLEDGRTSITIKIVSSASQVPTKTFGTNEKLAQARAENVKYDLVDHFNKKFAGKVNVVIEKTLVDGPMYEDDSANRSKYEPYQFVSLRTE